MERAGLSWPLGDSGMRCWKQLSYKAAGTKSGHRRSVEPDRADVHRELKHSHLALHIPFSSRWISLQPHHLGTKDGFIGIGSLVGHHTFPNMVQYAGIRLSGREGICGRDSPDHFRRQERRWVQ